MGKAETDRMRLETGMKFNSTKEWIDYMEKREAEIIAARTEAARDMKLIAEGRRILKEEGQEEADRMRAAAMAVEDDPTAGPVEHTGLNGDLDS